MLFLFLVLTSENLLLINLLMRADFPTFESPMRTTLQSWRASVNRCLTLPIFEIFLSDWINFIRTSYSGKQHGHLMSSLLKYIITNVCTVRKLGLNWRWDLAKKTTKLIQPPRAPPPPSLSSYIKGRTPSPVWKNTSSNLDIFAIQTRP